MKDVSHHLKYIQKKVLRETRKEQRSAKDLPANGHPNSQAENSAMKKRETLKS